MNFAIITMAIGSVVLMTTAVVTWPRRNTAHWIFSFLGLAAAVSIWLLGYAVELSVDGLDRKLFWAQVEYIGITFTPVAWFLFAYHFLNQSVRNLKATFLMLSIIPLITIAIAFTNSQHHLLWTQNVLDESSGVPMLANTYGGWFWIHSAYSYLLILGGIALFLRTIKLYPDPFRWQSVVLILAAAAPLAGNALYLAGLSPIPQFDLTPFAFAVSALLITWGVARLDLFDIVPIARRMVVEHMPDGIILLDMQNRILDINQEGQSLFRGDARSLVGESIAKIEVPLAQKASTYPLGDIDDEISIDENGTVQHYSVRIRPLTISSPHPRARILILRNISRRIKAEAGVRQRNQELQQLFSDAQLAREAAEQANQAKSDLLAKVSHELRTPLGVILGHAEMLQEGVYGPVAEEHHYSLNRIIENSNYLNEQVKDLLDLSRIGAGTLEIDLFEFNVEDALEQVKDRLQPMAEEKQLAFSLALSPDVPKRLVSNSIRFQQILVNLGTNAIRFTEKGEVRVSIEMANEDFWCIKVCDTGKGIPQTELKNIFLPFHQLQKSMIKGQGGIGLGLTIVKEIVTALNGQIVVESELEKGSQFIVTLPLYPKVVTTREVPYVGDE